jgi:hypothetical protein
MIGDGKITALSAPVCEKAEFTEEQLSQSGAFEYVGNKAISQRYIVPFRHSEGDRNDLNGMVTQSRRRSSRHS